MKETVVHPEADVADIYFPGQLALITLVPTVFYKSTNTECLQIIALLLPAEKN